jgi:glutathione S-transferase
MKLLYTKRSPYARKVRILAAEKNIELDYVDEDLTSKSELLLVSNPVGKIPTLICDDHTAICDSPLICEYLDALQPQPRFIPEDFAKRLSVLNTAAIADGLTDITLAVYMEKVRHPQDFNQKFIDAQVVAIERLLASFEEQVEDLKSWHLGSVGVVCALGYLQFRLGHLYHAEKYPQLNDWLGETAKRPSVKDSVPVV